MYFSPSSITAGVTPFALYWSVSNASRVEYIITLPSGGTITDTVTNLNSNTGQYITYTDGTLIGEIVAFGINGGTVSRSIRVTVAAQPTYSLTSNKTAVNEGDNFTITFTTNQPGSFPYTISGVSTQDINNADMSGSLSNGNQITYTASADNATDLANPETFTISLNNGLASASVNIYDTSQTSYYTFTRSTDSVNEGGSFYIDFATNQSGYFNYTITGVTSDDLNGAPLTGSINTGYRLNYTVKADNTTEGTETFTIKLDLIPSTTASVTIYDTSQTPFYTLTPSVTSVNEGGNFNITFTTNQGGSYYYSIRDINNFNSADIGGAALTGIVSNGDVLSYNVTADSITEGTEYFEIQITGNTNGNNILPYSASATVTIYDTSQTPVVTPTITSFSSSRPNEYPSADVTFNWTTTNTNYVNIYIYNPSGSYVTNITSFSPNGSTIWSGDANRVTGSWRAILIAVSSTGNSTSSTIYFTIIPVPTYNFSASTTSANEGGSFYIDFSTNQIGLFGYSISGVSSADIGDAPLSGFISNGSRLNYNVTADSSTEGTEYFQISSQGATATVTINDTSQTSLAVINSLYWSPSINVEGEPSRLFWTTTGGSSVSYRIQVPGAGGYSSAVTGRPLNGNSTFQYWGISGTGGTAYGELTVTNSAGVATVSNASTYIYARPTFTSASASPSNTYNTNDVTISWTSASNTGSVTANLTYPNGTTTVSYGSFGAGSAGFPVNGSSGMPIGTYTVTLTAISSINSAATTTTTINFTYTAASTFSATYNSFSSSDGQSSGPNTFFDQANSRITIRGYSASLIPNNNGRDSSTPYLDDTVPAYWNGQTKWAQATYTTTGDGYIYLYPIVSSEFNYDIATVQLDGTTVQLDGIYSSISGPSGNSRTYQWYFSYLGTYPNVTVNWKYSSPYPIKIAVSAGTHTIRLNYYKDGYLALGYDEAQLAWTWSAT